MNIRPFFLFVLLVGAFFVGVLFGNRDGDQATLRDCATQGWAQMAGGGSVMCRVMQSAP